MLNWGYLKTKERHAVLGSQSLETLSSQIPCYTFNVQSKDDFMGREQKGISQDVKIKTRVEALSQ
jgi:hypothetical protein